jgi:hypothetical protein
MSLWSDQPAMREKNTHATTKQDELESTIIPTSLENLARKQIATLSRRTQ